MASPGGFLDIHTKPELTETKFLSEDMASNWEKTWSCREFNTEKTYMETKTYVMVKKHLWYNGWVTLCGLPGDGTSSMAEHLVCNFVRQPWSYPEKGYSYDDGDRYQYKLRRQRYLQESLDEKDRPCYTPVYVSCTKDYMTKVDMDKHQIVVIDDIFGKGMYSHARMEDWRPYLQELLWTLAKTRPNTLVIICVNKAHLAQAPGEITHLEWFRRGVMFDLTLNNSISSEELPGMYNACRSGFVEMSRKDLSDIGVNNRVDSMGLVFRMHQQCKTFQYEGGNFLRQPWSSCGTVIDKVYRFDKIFYYTMSVAIVMDGHLDLSMVSLDQYDARTKMVMEKLIHILKVPDHVDLSKMRYAAKMMRGFFFQPVGQWVFKISHPKVYHLCAMSLCKMAMGDIIELLSRDFILNYVCTYNIYERKQPEMMVHCEKKHHEKLAERFTLEILSGCMKEFMQNESCSDDVFVTTWFKQMTEGNTLDAVVHQHDSVLQRTMFYWACHYGRGPVVKAILGAEDILKLQSEDYFPCEKNHGLQAACASTSDAANMAVKCLLDQGVDINAREKYLGENGMEVFGQEMLYLMEMEASPIHIAALRGHEDSVGVLIDKGADVNAVAADGQTLLHRAASRKDGHAVRLVRLLLEKGADIKAKTPSGRTPVQEAVISGICDTVQVLANEGAELGFTEDQRSMLSVAVQHRDEALVSYLLRKNKNPNGKAGIDGFYPLHLAVYFGDHSIMRSLMYADADANVLGLNGWTPLHLACYMGDLEAARQLIEQGANVNKDDFDRRAPIHIAASLGHFDLVNLLLCKGAKTEKMTYKKDTPLVSAARYKHQMTAWLLLMEGMEMQQGGQNSMLNHLLQN